MAIILWSLDNLTMSKAVVLELNNQIVYKLHLTVDKQIIENDFLLSEHFIDDLVLYLSRELFIKIKFLHNNCVVVPKRSP